MTAAEKTNELMERIGSEAMLNDLICWLDSDTLNKACDDIATDFDVIEYEDDDIEYEDDDIEINSNEDPIMAIFG